MDHLWIGFITAEKRGNRVTERERGSGNAIARSDEGSQFGSEFVRYRLWVGGHMGMSCREAPHLEAAKADALSVDAVDPDQKLEQRSDNGGEPDEPDPAGRRS